MDSNFKNRFTELWNGYFPGAELPIGFYYSEDKQGVEKVKKPRGHRCLIQDLTGVRKGKPLSFDRNSIGCAGGVRSLGFKQKSEVNFDYFLSCGIPGEIEGIRYKKTPELVRQTQSRHPAFIAPDETIVFKRWDLFETFEQPQVIIFFAAGDTLAGLFSLASFDEADPQAVIAPSCAGCASIVQYPYLEAQKTTPKSIFGMFDISARPYIQGNFLTFSIPWNKFEQMVENMEESFLITKTWTRLKGRIKRNSTLKTS